MSGYDAMTSRKQFLLREIEAAKRALDEAASGEVKTQESGDAHEQQVGQAHRGEGRRATDE